MKKGNKNQFDEINQEKRENSVELIRMAANYLISIGDSLSIDNIVKETIRLDSKDKGISKASFYSKKLSHIQTLMEEYGIGKYSALTIHKPNNEIDTNDIIKIINLNKKLTKDNKELKESKKNLHLKIEENQLEIKKLRGKCIELELKNKLNMPIPRNRQIK